MRIQWNQLAASAGRIIVLAAACCLVGCERTAIEVYSVPSEDPWKVPAGWRQEKTEGMRTARFAAPSPGGSTLDISIFSLPARSIGDPSTILNIWRKQLNLEPVSEAEAARQAQKVVMGSADGVLYELVSPGSSSEGKAGQRSLIAAAEKGGTSWFVKMTGDLAGVTGQKAAFVGFLQSLNFDHIPRPTPESGQNRDQGHDHDETSGATPARPEWQVPASWTEQSPGEVLFAKFVVTGDAGVRADINVSFSMGDGGGFAFNVDRWRKQLGLTPWDEAALSSNTTLVDAEGAKAQVVDFKGTDARSGRPARSVGVVLALEGRTWFYKLMGDETLVEREKAAFLKFITTAKHPNG